MKKLSLTKNDLNLLEIAKDEFKIQTQHDWHGVAAALRLKSGKIHTGMVLEAENPALTICAEPIVIGKSLADLLNDPIECIVAVRDRETTQHKVIPPCGRCREFITDYAPHADVIIFDDESSDLKKVKALDLLPFKYKNTPEE